MDLTSLAERVRRRRQELGMTQEELAAAARVDQSAVSKIEGGINRRPRKITLEALAEALRLDSVYDLIPEQRPPDPIDPAKLPADAQELLRAYMAATPEGKRALRAVARAVSASAGETVGGSDRER